jgi:hypothetical protein
VRRWAIPLVVSLSGTLLWWTHRLLTDVFPPFDNVFDTALWVICSVLKLVAIVFIPFVLGEVFAHCYRNKRATVIAVSAWSVALLVLLAALSLMRAPLVASLNNDAAKFFPNSMAAPGIASEYIGVDVQGQVARWRSGVTLLEECSLVIIGCLSLGIFGFTIGNKGLRTGFAALLCFAVLMLVGSLALGLLVWDYDIFFAGTMIAPLTADVFIPFPAADPMSEIGFLVYTVIVYTSWLLDRRFCRMQQAELTDLG